MDVGAEGSYLFERRGAHYEENFRIAVGIGNRRHAV